MTRKLGTAALRPLRDRSITAGTVMAIAAIVAAVALAGASSAGPALPRGAAAPRLGPRVRAAPLRASPRAFAAPPPADEAEAAVGTGGGGGGGGGIPPWVLPFAVPALGGALFGFDIGAASAVVRILGSPDVATAAFGAPLSEIELGNVASLPLFGGMLASAAIAFTGDGKIGRLFELRSAAALYACASALTIAAPTLPLLFAGRLLTGAGLGIALHAAPLYIAETAPSELRGRLVAYKEAAIVAGIVLGYAAGAVTGDAAAWRETLAPAIPLEAAMLALSLSLPESPRWLALRGRDAEAADAVVSLQRCERSEAEAQVRAIGASAAKKRAEAATAAGADPVAAAAEVGEAPSLGEILPKLVGEKGNRQALVIGCGLVLFQQLSGQPSVLYYANRLLESIGLGFVAAVGVGSFKLVMTLVSASLVESEAWGRRPLLLAGTAAMAVSLTGLSLLYATSGAALAAGGAGAAGVQAAVILLLFLYVGGYQVGFGPITWLILSEIFPLAVRSPAVSIGTLLNFGSNYIVGILFEIERAAVGEPALFGGFALVALAAVAFIYAKVPETRGLSLEEIEAKLTDGEF